LQRQFQLLNSLITFETGQDDLQNVIDFVSQDASQNTPVRTESFISVQTDRNGYRINRDGQCYQVGKSSWDLVYTLLRLIHEQVFQNVPDCIRVHAGCADYRDSRFIVIGDKGAGKTTLMLRMLFENKGFQVSGDEMVLINGNCGMPFPRRFHIKSGNVRLVPEIGPCLEKSPGFQVEGSHWLHGFSPTEAGFPWKIVSKQINAVYFLTPNHDGDSRVEECSGLQMVQKMMPMSYFSESDEHLKIQELCRLSSEVRSYFLHIGYLDKAVAIIRDQLAA
jgi:hypothetical protein